MLVQFLYPGSHVERPDRREREAALFAPGEESTAGTSVGTARVVVGNIGGKNSTQRQLAWSPKAATIASII
jgi:hypothetical protein